MIILYIITIFLTLTEMQKGDIIAYICYIFWMQELIPAQPDSILRSFETSQVNSGFQTCIPIEYPNALLGRFAYEILPHVGFSSIPTIIKNNTLADVCRIVLAISPGNGSAQGMFFEYEEGFRWGFEISPEYRLREDEGPERRVFCVVIEIGGQSFRSFFYPGDEVWALCEERLDSLSLQVLELQNQ